MGQWRAKSRMKKTCRMRSMGEDLSQNAKLSVAELGFGKENSIGEESNAPLGKMSSSGPPPPHSAG